MNWLIIGYGNPSRQDDGVGHWVINRLNEAWGLPTYGLLGEPGGPDETTVWRGDQRLRTLWLQQLDVGLAEEFAAADRVLLIDAHIEGDRRVDQPVGDGQIVGVTSHVATPETLLAVTAAAWGRRPAAMRHSIRGERFDFACGLSPAVEAAAAGLVQDILETIETHARSGSAAAEPSRSVLRRDLEGHQTNSEKAVSASPSVSPKTADPEGFARASNAPVCWCHAGNVSKGRLLRFLPSSPQRVNRLGWPTGPLALALRDTFTRGRG